MLIWKGNCSCSATRSLTSFPTSQQELCVIFQLSWRDFSSLFSPSATFHISLHPPRLSSGINTLARRRRQMVEKFFHVHSHSCMAVDIFTHSLNGRHTHSPKIPQLKAHVSFPCSWNMFAGTLKTFFCRSRSTALSAISCAHKLQQVLYGSLLCSPLSLIPRSLRSRTHNKTQPFLRQLKLPTQTQIN